VNCFNCSLDDLTNQIDMDEQSKNAYLPFDSSELDRFGLRVRQSDFARLMGCSKQAVSEWVKSGRVQVGADGLINPREAIARLIRYSDPAKVRSIVLRPLVSQIYALQARVAELETENDRLREDEQFASESASELLKHFDFVRRQLSDDWEEIRKADSDLAVTALRDWMHQIEQFGAEQAGSVLDYVTEPDGAPDE
jgi:transcriptional regulator with XRE-family HTH domain